MGAGSGIGNKQINPFSTLPDDLILVIYQFFDIREILNVAFVNRHSFGLLCSDTFWEDAIRRDFSIFNINPKALFGKSVTWREQYRFMHKLLAHRNILKSEKFAKWGSICRPIDSWKHVKWPCRHYKTILVGHKASGKTSFILTSIQLPDDTTNHIEAQHKPSLVEYYECDYHFNNVVRERGGKELVVRLMVFEIGGDRRLQTIGGSYYRGCSGIFVCFDLSNVKQSVANFEENVYPHLDAEKRTEFMPIVVVGMKEDLIRNEERTVVFGEVCKFLEKYRKLSMKFFLIQKNHRQRFYEVAEYMLKVLLENSPHIRSQIFEKFHRGYNLSEPFMG